MVKINRDHQKRDKNKESIDLMRVKDEKSVSKWTPRPSPGNNNTRCLVIESKKQQQYSKQPTKESVMVSVLYFAQARIAADGISSEAITFPYHKTNKDEVLRIIGKRHPHLNTLRKIIQISVNCKVVSTGETITLNERDEIALLPPIAGG